VKRLQRGEHALPQRAQPHILRLLRPTRLPGPQRGAVAEGGDVQRQYRAGREAVEGGVDGELGGVDGGGGEPGRTGQEGGVEDVAGDHGGLVRIEARERELVDTRGEVEAARARERLRVRQGDPVRWGAGIGMRDSPWRGRATAEAARLLRDTTAVHAPDT
jgi:hypothetical protein